MELYNRVLVKLTPRSKLFGAKLKNNGPQYHSPTTEKGVILPDINKLNPALWVPTEGDVVVSSIPELSKGDHVHMEYFGVVVNLGKWWDPGSEMDNKNYILTEGKKQYCEVFVEPRYIYYVENKKGPIRMIGDYNIIEPIMRSPSKLLIMPTMKTNYADCRHGKYAGKLVVFHSNADMGMLAHKRAVVHSRYVEAIMEYGHILPEGRRVLVKPAKAKVFDDEGNPILFAQRVAPNFGEIIARGPEATLQVGQQVWYTPKKNFTLIVTKELGTNLLYEEKNLLFTKTNDMIEPLENRLVIEADTTESTSKRGVLIPETAKEKPQSGTVLAAGPECKKVKKGDHVLFGKYSGVQLTVDEKDVMIIKENDCLAIL